MDKNLVVDTLKTKFNCLKSELDERGLRIWAATEANAIGYGGVVSVARATGLAESTIRTGKRELRESHLPDKTPRRVRKSGGGRKKLVEKDKELLLALDSLVEPTSRGDPISPLRWTCKSTRKLARELTTQGHPISHSKVGRLLSELGYSLQSNKKTLEGKSHPDRDAQFNHINQSVKEFIQDNRPVISIDTKKKELIGQFANSGKEFQPSGMPIKAETYDFPSLSEGKGIPYGIYDMANNQGWVSVGVDHDTAQFAVHSIRQWWFQMGKTPYPNATQLLITADGGGSNGARNRLWKYELQRLSDETGLSISVSHFPPGTSKWNKIEHRMFSHITRNWRGRPLTSHEVVVNLISNTTTDAGLAIKAELDSGKYPTGIKISDEQMAEINLEKNEFHGEWNYTLKSRINR